MTVLVGEFGELRIEQLRCRQQVGRRTEEFGRGT